MSKKYYTPSTSDLYKAPRYEGDIFDRTIQHKYAVFCEQAGVSLLSSVNARIDVLMDDNAIGEAQALEIFNTARKAVAETIQFN